MFYISKEFEILTLQWRIQQISLEDLWIQNAVLIKMYLTVIVRVGNYVFMAHLITFI